MDEFNHQKLFVAWFRANFQDVLIFAIPNGEMRSQATAKRLKDSGVLAGVPDLFIADGRPGLFIEMKDARGRLSAAQKSVIGEIEKNGYPVAVCYGYEQAKQAAKTYLRRTANDSPELCCASWTATTGRRRSNSCAR